MHRAYGAGNEHSHFSLKGEGIQNDASSLMFGSPCLWFKKTSPSFVTWEKVTSFSNFLSHAWLICKRWHSFHLPAKKGQLRFGDGLFQDVLTKIWKYCRPFGICHPWIWVRKRGAKSGRWPCSTPLLHHPKPKHVKERDWVKPVLFKLLFGDLEMKVF